MIVVSYFINDHYMYALQSRYKGNLKAQLSSKQKNKNKTVMQNIKYIRSMNVHKKIY